MRAPTEALQVLSCVCVCVYCTCVYVASPLHCIAQLFNIYLTNQVEGDLRINAILKQNATCQIFTPSSPHGGWMGWFP